MFLLKKENDKNNQIIKYIKRSGMTLYFNLNENNGKVENEF